MHIVLIWAESIVRDVDAIGDAVESLAIVCRAMESIAVGLYLTMVKTERDIRNQ